MIEPGSLPKIGGIAALALSAPVEKVMHAQQAGAVEAIEGRQLRSIGAEVCRDGQRIILADGIDGFTRERVDDREISQHRQPPIRRKRKDRRNIADLGGPDGRGGLKVPHRQFARDAKRQRMHLVDERGICNLPGMLGITGHDRLGSETRAGVVRGPSRGRPGAALPPGRTASFA